MSGSLRPGRAAAYRNHLHWSEFIGGDIVLTIPYKWQKRFNGSDVEVKPRMDNPVDSKIVEELLDKFDDYGGTRRTLRGFIAGYERLLGIIRDFMIQVPDV